MKTLQGSWEERTGFQESRRYAPGIDLKTDFVMVYGLDKDFEKRVEEWRRQGYVVHLMTGVSWGDYQDYLNGLFDGRPHWDEAQKDRRRSGIIHGTSEDIPYMVPTLSYSEYLAEKIRPAVDAGIEAIHLEEPEFWVEGGYEEAFRREWEIYYREPWSPPHQSPDSQYRASKLKAFLYARCLERLCSSLKDYAKLKYNRDIRFYVPTHSLINYTQWRIVSPESRLAELPAIDGYIAQVWTGTSRTPNVYEGVRKERTFETAFLEYGIMQELVRGTDKKMWFLHDPIEDDPGHTWSDYRNNYLKTVTASLFHTGISSYEVCPWPGRIFTGDYPAEGGSERESIPEAYATTLLIIMHALANMKQADFSWEAGNIRVGLLLADSAMFQRYYDSWDEKAVAFKYDGTNVESAQGGEYIEPLDWSPFYGLALPLLKHGAVLRPVQLDNIRRFPGYLDDYEILILSYEYMKPEYPDIHNGIAQWVREGGSLVYAGDGSDAYHGIREWWNQGRRKYNDPAEHLFECMGLERAPGPGLHHVGKGNMFFLPVNPVSCAYEKTYADMLRGAVIAAVEANASCTLEWRPTSRLVLRRGPYLVATVLEESVDSAPLVIKGSYVNLFEPELPVVEEISIKPGEQALLADITRFSLPFSVVAAASRIEAVEETGRGISFTAYGPENVRGAARLRCAERPGAVVIAGPDGGRTLPEFSWDARSRTLFFNYENNPSGVIIKIEF